MKINNVLDEHTTYEVLITTRNIDGTVHTKPFGIKLIDNKLILNLFPNTTLKNIQSNPNFKVQFSLNPLIYTKAFFNKLNKMDYIENEVLVCSDYIIDAKVEDILRFIQDDDYGTSVYYRITANIINFKKLKNRISTINRSTNIILDLLIKASRFYLMNSEEKNQLINEINKNYKFILKEGNQDHLDSLNLIKKEMNKLLKKI